MQFPSIRDVRRLNVFIQRTITKVSTKRKMFGSRLPTFLLHLFTSVHGPRPGAAPGHCRHKDSLSKTPAVNDLNVVSLKLFTCPIKKTQKTLSIGFL